MRSTLNTGGKSVLLKSLAVSLLLLLFAPVVSFAQHSEGLLHDPEKLRDEFSAFIGDGLNFHSANFQNLPGVPNCCPRFGSGSGNGLVIAPLGYEHPLSEQWSIGARLGYQSLAGTLTRDESTIVLLKGDSTVGTFEHTVDAKIGMLALSPHATYKLIDRVRLSGGLAIGLILSNTFSQKEVLLAPTSGGTFENGRRIRNEFTGATPGASSIYLGLTMGAGYRLPLDPDGVLNLEPQISFTYGLTPVVSGLTWSASSLAGGLAVVWSPKEAPPPPPPPVVVPPVVVPPPPPVVVVPPPVVKLPLLTAALTTTTIDSNGQVRPLDHITIEDYIRTQYRPLLNFIFFDENSGGLPSRYHLLTKDEANQFRLASLNTYPTLPLYYEVLNIIGTRMRSFPKAKLTIVGCNADMAAEKGNKELSKTRAEGVLGYLRDVWGVEANRLKLEVRNLPEKPSAQNDPDGQGENRRVEILASEWQVLEPIFSIDTAHIPKPPIVQFNPSVVAEKGLDQWQIVAATKGGSLKEYKGRDTLPKVVTWELEKESEILFQKIDTVKGQLRANDHAGQSVNAPDVNLPVRHYTLADKHREGSIDTIISRYSLILFDFDKKALSESNKRIASFVKERISSDAKVSIMGYTDRMGNDDYNKQLSENRARSTQSYIGLPNADVRGLGRSILLYDNNLPEGRFYSRTVTVVVSTPMKR